MQITVTMQEASNLRKGLHSFIKHKKANVKNIQKNLAKDGEDAEVTTIRRQMLARREADIRWAEQMLEDLSHIGQE